MMKNLPHMLLAVLCFALSVAAAACGGRSAGQHRSPAGDASVDMAGPAGCLTGAAFVHCQGPITPALFCQAGKDGACKWVSTGKPAAPYTAPTQPACAPSTSWWPLGKFLFRYGDQPWTRTRGMALKVKVDAALKVPGTGVTCVRCAPPWTGADTPCTVQAMAQPSFPGTYLVWLFTGGMHGWDLELEVDVAATPPRARVCRHAFTDALGCSVQSVTCADVGTVILSALPSATSYSDVKLSFKATFGADTISGTVDNINNPTGVISCKP